MRRTRALLLALALLCCSAVAQAQAQPYYWQVLTVPGWYTVEAPADWGMLAQDVVQDIQEEIGQEGLFAQLGVATLPDNFRVLTSPMGEVMLVVSVTDNGMLMPALMVELVVVPGLVAYLRGQDPLLHWQRAPGMYPAGERTFWRIDGVLPEGTSRRSMLITQQGSRMIQLIFNAEVGITYTGADLEELIHHVASTLVLEGGGQR